VVFSQGGEFGGWSIYLKGGAPRYCYNLFGMQRTVAAGDAPLPAGTHQVRMEFTYDGGGLGKGGDIALYADGQEVAKGRVEGTHPMMFSGDETADVGEDTASPVSADYTSAESRFTGTVNWVQIDLEGEDEDHLISPEERLRVAMARQ
jgi:arylsulfatase